MSKHPLNVAWLSGTLLQTMIEGAERKFPHETGGVLLGYWANPYDEVVITEIAGPGPAASHSPVSFKPDYDYQDSEVCRIYNSSGRKHTYLGDWHSHPHSTSHLSRTDKKTFRRLAVSPEARTPVPIMAVVGLSTTDWALGLWKGEMWKLGRFMLGIRAMRLEVKIYDKSRDDGRAKGIRARAKK